MATTSPSPSPIEQGQPRTSLLPRPTATRYRTISFVPRFTPNGQRFWVARTNDTAEKIGYIHVYEPWSSFVFSPVDGTILSKKALSDIITFIRQATL